MQNTTMNDVNEENNISPARVPMNEDAVQEQYVQNISLNETMMSLL